MKRGVLAPDIVRWTVRRRWLPASWSSDRGRYPDAPNMTLVTWMAWVLVPFGVRFYIGLAVALVVGAALLLITLALLTWRVLFGGAWVVEARSGSGAVMRQRVVGWQASLDAVEAWADELERDGALREPERPFKLGGP